MAYVSKEKSLPEFPHSSLEVAGVPHEILWRWIFGAQTVTFPAAFVTFPCFFVREVELQSAWLKGFRERVHCRGQVTRYLARTEVKFEAEALASFSDWLFVSLGMAEVLSE